jgi:GT2 family glycosyltransferase
VGTCLASLAAATPPADEILVVDQSAEGGTAAVVGQHAHLPGLRYLRQSAVGLSRARNLGIAEATADLVAFTDDDCEVAADFVRTVAEAFQRLPQACLLFGQVEAGAHDASLGLVPSCRRDHEFVARTPKDRRRLGGMGACMAARRAALVELGGFDARLGAGATFPAAEETDLAARALARGLAVVETPGVRVIHHGFRSWHELDSLSESYLFGTGAMYGKHTRLWPGRTTLLMFSAFSRWAVAMPRIRYLAKPQRLARLVAFARGFGRGIRAPLDRESALFSASGE